MAASEHEKLMRIALGLAERGRGKVEPNPMVGAVVVSGGKIIGQGYHRRFGQAHAEVNALADSRGKLAGARMYVTLEPCCQQGKTPACTQALISAGLAEVVVATKDPSAKVNGRGINQIRRAGIKVTVGPLATEGRRHNAAFFKLHRKGRPFVLLKWAQSLDGKIATAGGQSRWISNEKSRQFGHRLRRQSQAILVGIGTALADNPLLTARPALPDRPLMRIVVDSQLRLPLRSQLVRTAGEAPVFIATTTQAIKGNRLKADQLSRAGAEVYGVSRGPGRVDLGRLLDLLGERQISNLLVEGGSEILGQFITLSLADEIAAFICPKIIGGKRAPGPVGGSGVSDLAGALKLKNIRIRRIADDLLVRADLPALDEYLYE